MLTVTQPPVESSLAGIARALVADGRGILAADESLPTIEKRFRTIDVESTEEARRSYRELLFTAPDVEQYISGVILFDGTTHQVDASGTPLVDVLTARGIIPGVKVDRGAKPLAGSPRETVTEGLDGLRERLHDYHERGLRFTKWRAVIAIGDGLPTPYCIRANADALARYAALSQEEGLVPIVEPEVLIDGDHTIERCYDVTEATLHYVFDVLHQHRPGHRHRLRQPWTGRRQQRLFVGHADPQRTPHRARYGLRRLELGQGALDGHVWAGDPRGMGGR